MTLVFKLKSLVIGHKSDLMDQIVNYINLRSNQISCCLYHKNLGLYQDNAPQQINQVFDINYHLSLPTCQVVQVANSYNW